MEFTVAVSMIALLDAILVYFCVCYCTSLLVVSIQSFQTTLTGRVRWALQVQATISLQLTEMQSYREDSRHQPSHPIQLLVPASPSFAHRLATPVRV